MKTLRAVGWGETLVLALALHSGMALARTADMYDAPKVESTAVAPADAMQIRERILSGAKSLGWVVTREEPGLIGLSYDKQGKHQVTVAVRYDSLGYKVDYVSSFNLNYEELGSVRKIHPTYNRWIHNLIKRIGPV